MGLFTYIKTPYVATLVVASSAAFVGAAFMGFHYLTNDPTVVLIKKKETPFPYLLLKQDQNIKLYSVNNKFEDSTVKPTYTK